MTVKESSTPVKDTFLGFYSQESFSSNSPENLLDENGQKIYEINSVEDFLLEFNNENNEVIQHSIPDEYFAPSAPSIRFIAPPIRATAPCSM